MAPTATEEVVNMQIDLTVRAEIADQLITASIKRDCPPAAIIADVIERALADNLIDAILDDGS